MPADMRRKARKRANQSGTGMLLHILEQATTPTRLLVLLALVAAGFIKGTIGVGMPIVALPLLSMVVDVRASVMMLSMPLILSNIPQAIEGGQNLDCLRRLSPVLVGMVPGLVAGVVLLLHVEPDVARAVAGLVIIGVAILTLLAPKLQLNAAAHSPVGLAAGFFGGALGGLAAMPGPLVFVFLIAKGLHGKAFTKEASLFLVVSATALVISLYSSRSFGWTDFAISIIAVVPVLIEMHAGQKLRDRLPESLFKKIVLLAVAGSGISLILKSIVD
jgi:uncharacterized membrane protein YfcA